jgi:hypothetical protein
MIYLDTSVALAHLLAEDRVPPNWLWAKSLVSSRLLEYELWTRINARGLNKSHGEAVRDVIGRIALLELTPSILARALEPFPVQVRTLDAFHLASADFLRQHGSALELASYDDRLVSAARRIKIPVCDLNRVS